MKRFLLPWRPLPDALAIKQPNSTPPGSKPVYRCFYARQIISDKIPASKNLSAASVFLYYEETIIKNDWGWRVWDWEDYPTKKGSDNIKVYNGGGLCIEQAFTTADAKLKELEFIFLNKKHLVFV